MTPETAAKLREPFPPEVIGKLPRVWCGACREATKANRRQSACQQHEVRPCRDCRNRLTDAHLHLDYVGHAETTDRLLQVDPEWTWEPLAFDPRGLPALDDKGGLWIRLTVAGVTRLGYGHAGEKTGPDAVKETIGDALRNAAMRFGVALDLWGAKFKEDSEPGEQVERDCRPSAGELRATIARVGGQKGMTLDELTVDFADWAEGKHAIGTTEDTTVLAEYLQHLTGAVA